MKLSSYKKALTAAEHDPQLAGEAWDYLEWGILAIVFLFGVCIIGIGLFLFWGSIHNKNSEGLSQELITDYSYYITEDEHVVAAIYDDGEEYTGYSLENFEKQVTDRIKVYEEEKEQKN